MYVFESFSRTVCEFLKGEIPIGELSDPEAVFCFHCCVSHALPEDVGLVGYEAANVLPYEDRRAVEYKEYSVVISSLPERLQGLCQTFLNVVQTAHAEGRLFVSSSKCEYLEKRVQELEAAL